MDLNIRKLSEEHLPLVGAFSCVETSESISGTFEMLRD